MTTLETIQDINQKISNQINVIALKQSALDKNNLNIFEYQRQIDYHNNNGDSYNAEQVAPLLTAEYAKNPNLKIELDNAKGYLSSLKDDLDNAKKSLTPEEKTVILNESQIKLNDSNVNALRIKAETDKNKFTQNSTKYFIIGSIVLTIVVIVVFIIKRGKSV